MEAMYDVNASGSAASKMCVVCSDRALSCNFGAITCESCKAFFRRHAHKHPCWLRVAMEAMYDVNASGSAASKMCVVCSDRALSCNFGAITCESCKAFFRRHAHKEIYGQCDGNCPITVETRSYCRRCRLAKCFTVGMKKELILSDEQKLRRRQKIMDNRTKRQTTDGGPEGTSYQDGGDSMDKMPTLPPAHSFMPTQQHMPQEGHFGQPMVGSWPNISMMGKDDSYLQQSAMSQSKRRIWDSADNNAPYPATTIVKRQAVDMIPDFGGGTKPGGGINYVSSTDEELHMVPSTSNLPVTPPGYLSGTTEIKEEETPPHEAEHHPHKPQPPLPTPIPVPVSSQASTSEIQQRAKELNLPMSIFEPCFFGLHPPNLDSEAFRMLDTQTQHKLLIAVEAYREFCRPLVTLQDKLNPQDYVSLLNSGEECYRQLVRFAKRLPEFRALSQDDQIALLKGNVIEIMIIRFSKCYNLQTNSWMFPHGGNVQNVSGMINDEIFTGFCVQDYSNFVMQALESTQGDDLILIVLKVITLFYPNIPNIEDKDAVHEAHDQYKEAINAYIRIVYPDHSSMFDHIDTLMERLRSVGKAAHDVMWKSQVEDLHPLLKEMFDLREPQDDMTKMQAVAHH